MSMLILKMSIEYYIATEKETFLNYIIFKHCIDVLSLAKLTCLPLVAGQVC